MAVAEAQGLILHFSILHSWTKVPEYYKICGVKSGTTGRDTDRYMEIIENELKYYNSFEIMLQISHNKFWLDSSFSGSVTCATYPHI